MIVYHMSTDKIEEFCIPYNGLHVGTLYSAKQALMYKRNKIKKGVCYLHTLCLDNSVVEDIFDCGMDWRDNCPDKSKLYSYTNRYEPSTGKSFVMFDTRFIKLSEVTACSFSQVSEDIDKDLEEK